MFPKKRYKNNQHLKPYRIYCHKIQLADGAIRYGRMFFAGEKLVFRDSKINCYSNILKRNCFILHLHDSLLQWDKMRTVAQSQQLVHQDPPGPSKKYPEKILYINIFYISYLFFIILLHTWYP